MAEFPQLKALWQAHIGSTLQKPNVAPGGLNLGVVGVQAISGGAAATQVWSPYVQIVAATIIPDPCWIVGFMFNNFLLDAPFDGDFAIASGAGGFEVDLIEVPQVGYVASAVGEGATPVVFLPFPVKILGSPRLAVRVRKLSAASAAGATLKLCIYAGLGT
jgi:hypothetical protein